MTNVKVQIPNECQMPKPKTNNHETTKFRKHESRINLFKACLKEASKPGVEGISEGIPDHVEGKYDHHDGCTGGEGKDGILQEISIAFIDHGAPGRTRRFDTDTEKAEARFGKD